MMGRQENERMKRKGDRNGKMFMFNNAVAVLQMKRGN